MLEFKNYQAIVDDMKAFIIANQDKITDFNEGSVISAFIEAVARQFEQSHIRARVGFQTYLKNVPYDVFNFQKKLGIKASGQVKFSRTSVAPSIVNIPAGVRVATSAGVEFLTGESTTIPAGGLESGLVSVLAEEVGQGGNVGPLAINQIVAPVAGVETVSNPIGTAGGVNDETDYEFEQRFIDYIEGLGKASGPGLSTGAKTIDGVRSATVIEHFPALSGLYHCTLYVDDGSGTATTEMVNAVKRVIDGDGTVNYPGYRAAGVNVRIMAPIRVLIDVTIHIVSDGVTNKIELKQAAEAAITDYINARTIGQDVVENRIVDAVMDVDGVYDLSMSTPTDNVIIGNDQIARIGTLTVTVE